ncbi:MAG: TIGR03936 family radical SAM-associated protein [Lachnospiraceae bacterium]|nr:TIGR03936 family radical SAM-associated protein [Lachnospiraceae bacterium]
MKIRIKFSKTGNLKYIGHLDIMRCFQKVMRRAEVDIAYSAGFSPHQIMSFASPLGLGLTSEGEYVDIEVLSTQSSETMLQKINAAMVEGMQALGYVELPEKAKTAMSVVAAADYRLTFDVPVFAEMKAKFAEFLLQDSIVITKKTKKQELELEIRPLIFETQFEEDQENGKTTLFLKLSAGSAANLKPEQVMDAFCAFAAIDAETLPYHIHRLEMYADVSKKGEGRKLIPLERMGEMIV